MDEALDIADHIIVMRDGRVEQIDTPTDLLNEQANDFVREFIGTERINRKRNFGDKQLKEFRFLFDANAPEAIHPVTGSMTMTQAKKLLDKNPDEIGRASCRERKCRE